MPSASRISFRTSYALLDKDRRVLSWDEDFALEFRDSEISAGRTLDDIAIDCGLPIAASARGDGGYLFGGDKVAIVERGMTDGGALRVAARAASDPSQIHAAAFATIDSIKNIRRRLEAELRESKRASEEANQLKSEFLANMSHEIRTPLNAIIGFTDVIRNELFGPIAPPRYREYLEHVYVSGAHLLRLVDDILDLAKLESGLNDVEPAPLLVSEELNDVVSLLDGRAMAKGIKLEWAVDDTAPPTIFADRLRLRQVLINLIGNALKFSERGPVRAVALPSADGGLGVRIEVRDHGIGISPEGQTRLFKKFSQADTSIAVRFGGTGLGLAISKKLVDMMGGKIGVRSEIGCGSTFWVDLPSGDAPALDVPALDTLALAAKDR